MSVDTKSKILDAAIRIFSEKGLSAQTKVTEIAEAADISKSQVHYHFGGKQVITSIILSIRIDAWETYHSKLSSKLKDNDKPIDKIMKILSTLEELLFKGGNATPLAKVLTEPLPHLSDIKEKSLKNIRKEVHRNNLEFIRFIDESIAEGQRDGSFKKSYKALELRRFFYGGIVELLKKQTENENKRVDLRKVVQGLIADLLINK